VKVWVKELRKMLGNDITLCIAGNKVDLEKERHVTVDEAETYVLRVETTLLVRHFEFAFITLAAA